MQNFRIEPAGEADIPIVLSLIREMAAYEHASREIEVNETLLRQFVFSDRPHAEVFLGYYETAPVAYAIILPKFYSYQGRPNLYLEDLYVQPHLRGKGIGKVMMTHLAKLALDRGCAFLEWSVLDWNEPAIQFYRRLGARRVEDRSHFYLDREALQPLAVTPSQTASSGVDPG